MAEPGWAPPMMKQSDRARVEALALRLATLGVRGTLVGALRAAVAVAEAATDDELKRGAV